MIKISPNAYNIQRYPRMRSNIPWMQKNIKMGSDIPECEWGSISRNAQIISKWGAEHYPRMQMGSNMMISLNANGERCNQYAALLLVWWCFLMFMHVHLYAKKSGSTHDSTKDYWHIKATSETGPRMHMGSPRMDTGGVRQNNLHMGRHIMHNKIVRIWELTYTLLKRSIMR